MVRLDAQCVVRLPPTLHRRAFHGNCGRAAHHRQAKGKKPVAITLTGGEEMRKVGLALLGLLMLVPAPRAPVTASCWS